MARANAEVKQNEEKKTSPQRKVFESKRPVTSSSKTRWFNTWIVICLHHRYIYWFLFRKPKVEQATDKKPSTPVSTVPPDDYGCVFTPRAALGKITEGSVYRRWHSSTAIAGLNKNKNWWKLSVDISGDANEIDSFFVERSPPPRARFTSQTSEEQPQGTLGYETNLIA